MSGSCWVTDTKKDERGMYLQMKGDRPYVKDTDWYRMTHPGASPARVLRPV